MNLLRISNDHLQLTVAPEFGGKVLSLIDNADGHELLFQHPHPNGKKLSPLYDINYGKGWYAAWDECFPGIAPGPYPEFPYQGITVPDHGELWGLPASCTVQPDAITTYYRGVRFAYNMTRTLRLVGSSLVAEYTVQNPSAFPLRFVWAQHALLSCTAAFELDPTPWAARLSHDHQGTDIQKPFTFPKIGEEDVSKHASLPPNKGWKLFSEDPIPRPMVIRYPTRRRSLTIGYTSSDVPAYWGIWINTGGWAGHQHVAVEATTGRYDQVDKATANGVTGVVKPYSTVRWATDWRVGSA